MAKGDHLRGRLLYQAESTITPHDLFCAGPVYDHIDRSNRVVVRVGRRFLRKRRELGFGECLVYIDATCTINGSARYTNSNCIVACEPYHDTPTEFDETKSFMDIASKEITPLPTWTVGGKKWVHASIDRAKLYAAILALTARSWKMEGWKMLIVAGDLEYVVGGITDWVWTWQENSWIKSDGQRVLNDDLWELLLERVLELNAQGIDVKFWKVPGVKGFRPPEPVQQL